MTHADLVARAEKWLRDSRRCAVVLTEAGANWEFPDAIGWRTGYDPVSILVECKTSRGDFLVDRKKPFRLASAPELGMGRFRYFLAPPGIIRPEELPLRWGLLEIRARSVRVKAKARRIDLDTGGANLGLRNELSLALGELRKVQWFLLNGSGWQSRKVERRLMPLPSDYRARYESRPARAQPPDPETPNAGR